MKVAVLGAGAWGTALAMHIGQQHQVSLWAHKQSHVDGMRRVRANPKYLGDFTFPEQLSVTADLAEALAAADFVLSVVPTSGFRDTLRQLRQLSCQVPIVWASKGLEPSSALLPNEVAKQELGEDYPCGVLSGPSFAAELVRGLPTAVTLAMQDTSAAKLAAAALHAGSLRVYTSDDVCGVAVGGALKNVMAIAAGISDGMQFGNNARAALITRGLAEMTRFGMALGAQKDTFMGLAGAGDLILTCTGQYSRNREVGLQLASGRPLQEILQTLGHVAEGVYTAREVYQRAKALQVEMPITDEVNQVLSHGKSARDAVMDLLGRQQKAENG